MWILIKCEYVIYRISVENWRKINLRSDKKSSSHIISIKIQTQLKCLQFDIPRSYQKDLIESWIFKARYDVKIVNITLIKRYNMLFNESLYTRIIL